MRRIVICCMLVVLLLVLVAETYAGSAGSTGGAFLRIGMGARAIGIGSAFTSIADDVSSIYWNPAGLSKLKYKEALFMHTQWVTDIKSEYLAQAQPLKYGGYGVSLLYLYTTDIRRNKLGKESGSFNNYDSCVTLAYGYKLNSNISLGLSLKIISGCLDTTKANSYCIDIGGLYKRDNLRLGAVIQNLGLGMKFRDESDPMPINFKLGAGYKLLDKNLTLAVDIDKPIDDNISIKLGTEYSYKDTIIGRIGYQIGRDVGGLSTGIGFKFRDYKLDYAFVPYDKLGNTHRISLTMQFAPKIEEKPPIPKVIPPIPKDLKPTPVPEVIEMQPTVIVYNWRGIITPDGDGIEDMATFNIRVGGFKYPIETWELNITTTEDKSVKIFVGSGKPPFTIVWDGRNNEGQIVPIGTYFYILYIKDSAGNKFCSDKQSVIIR
ncbi:MAG: PorV/PorQ family protein [bacterium]